MATISKRIGKQGITWSVRVRRAGYPNESKTFDTRADAQAWARSVERQIDTHLFIPSKESTSMTFVNAAQRYRTEVLPKQRGKVQAEYVLRRVTEEFGPYALSSITPKMMASYRDARLKCMAPQTVVHELVMISSVFKSAMRDWGVAVPRGNPVAATQKPIVNNARDRRLDDGEEALLLSALIDRASPWPHAAAVIAIETAARMSEILSLRWADIDLARRTARLRGVNGGKTKNGDNWRDIPLSSAAINLLSNLTRHADGRVIPLTQNALKIAWRRSLQAARKAYIRQRLAEHLAEAGYGSDAQLRELRAIKFKKRQPMEITIQLLTQIEIVDQTLLDLHFHDLRHEATSRLAEKLQMHELMKVTGHKTSRMLARYYHPRIADLARKLD